MEKVLQEAMSRHWNPNRTGGLILRNFVFRSIYKFGNISPLPSLVSFPIYVFVVWLVANKQECYVGVRLFVYRVDLTEVSWMIQLLSHLLHVFPTADPHLVTLAELNYSILITVILNFPVTDEETLKLKVQFIRTCLLRYCIYCWENYSTGLRRA